MKTKVAVFAVLGVLACAGLTSAQTRTAPIANTASAIAFRLFFLATFQDFARGGEVRVNSWAPVAIDVQCTFVPGILGIGGLSRSAGSGGGAEINVGGIAPRLRVIIGH